MRVPKDEAVIERAVVPLLDPYPWRRSRDEDSLILRYEYDIPAFVANGFPRNRGSSIGHGPPFPPPDGDRNIRLKVRLVI